MKYLTFLFLALLLGIGEVELNAQSLVNFTNVIMSHDPKTPPIITFDNEGIYANYLGTLSNTFDKGIRTSLSPIQECKCAVKRHYDNPKVQRFQYPSVDSQWEGMDLEECSKSHNRNTRHHLKSYSIYDGIRNNSPTKGKCRF